MDVESCVRALLALTAVSGTATMARALLSKAIDPEH